MKNFKEALKGILAGMKRAFTQELVIECFKNYFNPVRHWRQMKEVKSTKRA